MLIIIGAGSFTSFLDSLFEGGSGEVRGKKVGVLGARMPPTINIFVRVLTCGSPESAGVNRLHLVSSLHCMTNRSSNF